MKGGEGGFQPGRKEGQKSKGGGQEMPECIFYFSSLTEAEEIELCLHRVIQLKLSLRLLP